MQELLVLPGLLAIRRVLVNRERFDRPRISVAIKAGHRLFHYLTSAGHSCSHQPEVILVRSLICALIPGFSLELHLRESSDLPYHLHVELIRVKLVVHKNSGGTARIRLTK